MRIAVVGTGSIASRHLRNLLELGYRDLIAVSEFSRRSSIEIDGFSIPTSNDFSLLLSEDRSIEVVFLCNPSVFHWSYTLKAVNARKHVYLEKPVAVSVDEITESARLINKSSVTIAVGNQFRFHPQLVEIKEKLKKSELGCIHSVHAIQGEHIADYHPGEDFRLSYATRQELGGGVLLTQIHQIDFLNWLLGPFDHAFAMAPESSALNLGVEENISYLLMGPHKAIVYGHVDYLRRPKQSTLAISGELGSLEWSYYDGTLSWTGAKPGSVAQVTELQVDRDAIFKEAITDFFRSIQDGSAPRSTLVDGINAVAIVDTIKRSCSTHSLEEIRSINELS